MARKPRRCFCLAPATEDICFSRLDDPADDF